MKNFDTRVYSVSDFLEWDSNNLLNLSPDFQRRSVWSEKAKSYLIDTMVRGKPIPKILISQELQGSRSIRVVVDGQQRLRAILGFLNGDVKISRAHNKKLAGKTFDDLSKELRDEFLQYELGVDLLFNMSYEDVLDIFARLNAYTVTLNKQERINATYLGYFKQYAYKYGIKYVRYFIDAGVITKNSVNRMKEAELASDLFVALIDSVQTNKTIEQYYKEYEDEIGGLEEKAEWFDETMSYVGSIYPADQLQSTNWSRIHLFYTLFTSIAHCLYGLGGLDDKYRANINERNISRIRVVLDEISAKYDLYASNLEDSSTPKDYREFIDFSRRRTTDTAARVFRANFVCKALASSL